ncbi:hypothetical protein L1887_58577 [Cichorium endivia]|nr:hypothetical protein L1887_58577 [Cichorium endivia]
MPSATLRHADGQTLSLLLPAPLTLLIAIALSMGRLRRRCRWLPSMNKDAATDSRGAVRRRCAAQAVSEIGASDARRGAGLTSLQTPFLTASTCETALHHGRAHGSCPRSGVMRMASDDVLNPTSDMGRQTHPRTPKAAAEVSSIAKSKL